MKDLQGHIIRTHYPHLSSHLRALAQKIWSKKLRSIIALAGRPTIKQMFIMMFGLIRIVATFPCVAWSGFIYGINSPWYNDGTVISPLPADPYKFLIQFLDTVYIRSVIGAALACVPLAPQLEHRLCLMLAISSLIQLLGLFCGELGAYYDVSVSDPLEMTSFHPGQSDQTLVLTSGSTWYWDEVSWASASSPEYALQFIQRQMPQKVCRRIDHPLHDHPQYYQLWNWTHI
jgi:hypothetical protein